MQNENGVILNFYKQLNTPEEDKNKLMKSFLSYVIERTPDSKDYMMLNKLIKDFGYDIIFEALVSTRYNINFTGNYWPYIVSVCKRLLKESIVIDLEYDLSAKTKAYLDANGIGRKENK